MVCLKPEYSFILIFVNQIKGKYPKVETKKEMTILSCLSV